MPKEMPGAQRAASSALPRRKNSLELDVAKAFAHPVRARVLAAISERPLSASELSDAVGETTVYLSYHVRVLRKLGLIEPVRSEKVRGATKTIYRACARMLLDEKTWPLLSKQAKHGISEAAVNEVMERASAALSAGTFDSRDDSAVITLKMDLDEPAWRKVAAIVTEAYEKIIDVEAASSNAEPATERSRFTVSLLAYESPAKAPKPGSS